VLGRVDSKTKPIAKNSAQGSKRAESRGKASNGVAGKLTRQIRNMVCRNGANVPKKKSCLWDRRVALGCRAHLSYYLESLESGPRKKKSAPLYTCARAVAPHTRETFKKRKKVAGVKPTGSNQDREVTSWGNRQGLVEEQGRGLGER